MRIEFVKLAPITHYEKDIEAAERTLLIRPRDIQLETKRYSGEIGVLYPDFTRRYHQLIQSKAVLEIMSIVTPDFDMKGTYDPDYIPILHLPAQRKTTEGNLELLMLLKGEYTHLNPATISDDILTQYKREIGLIENIDPRHFPERHFRREPEPGITIRYLSQKAM